MTQKRNRGVRATPEGIGLVKERLTQIRFQDGLTSEDLMDKAGLGIDTLERRFLRGRKVERDSAIRIIQVLGLKLEDIINLNDWYPSPAPDVEDLPDNHYMQRPAIAQAVGLEPTDIAEPNEWLPDREGKPVLPVLPDKDYYIERFLRGSIDSSAKKLTIEEKCRGELLKPGALIRIKAPQFMGKTSLVNRVLSKGNKPGNCRKIRIEIEKQKLTDLEDFLRWLCVAVSKKLGLENKLDQFWDVDYTLKENTTSYFQDYLFNQTPDFKDSIILILEKFEYVLENPQIFDEFCSLLRGWSQLHITGENNVIQQIWKKLRLVVVYSTEVYGTQNINHSPLNVGTEIELLEFTQKQVLELAKKYQLSLKENEVEQLMGLVGGHPFLVHRAIREIANCGAPLDQILEEAHTQSGIYGNHLLKLLTDLQCSTDLYSKFREIVASDNQQLVNSIQVFRLKALGLIQVSPSPKGDLVTPRCRLYKKFFQNQFAIESDTNYES